jgi:hypothetical protein
MRIVFAIASGALALFGVGAAQAQQAAQPTAQPAMQPTVQRVTGEVTAATATSVSVKGADGKITQVTAVPNVIVATSKPSTASDIKAGDFVASGNATIGDNIGRATEIRVMAPGVQIGEGNRAMAQPNMMMTHGNVVAIKEGEGGRDLLVRFQGGERHVVVPPDVRVVGQTPLKMADLKPGTRVTVILNSDPKAAPTTNYILVNPPAPAAR